MSIGPRNMAALANQRRRRKRQRELLQEETAERLKELERRSRAAVAAAERERAAAAPGAGPFGPSGGKTGAGTRILLGDRLRDELTLADPAPGHKPRAFVYRADKPILDSYGLALLRVSDEEASPPAAGRADLLQRVAAPQRLAQAATPPARRTPSQPGTLPQAGAGSAPSAGAGGGSLRARPLYTDRQGKTSFRVEQSAWGDWSQVLDQHGITGIEKHIYQDFFSHEGGTKPDGSSPDPNKPPTVAGVDYATLQDMHRRHGKPLNAAGVPKGTRPDELTPKQRIEVYRILFDYALSNALDEDKGERGHKLLESFGDTEAAVAFADALFRVGRTGGARLIERSINQLFEEKGLSDRVDVDRAVGAETVAAYKRLIRDARDRVRLLDILAELRCRKHPKSEGECARANYHRIRP